MFIALPSQPSCDEQIHAQTLVLGNENTLPLKKSFYITNQTLEQFIEKAKVLTLILCWGGGVGGGTSLYRFVG